MITVIDYGVGNLYSLVSSLKHLGISCMVTDEPDEINRADKIILPGVGAFGDAVQKLHETKLFDVVKQKAKSGAFVLGICLGMQLLFETGYEHGTYKGLELIKGDVRALSQVLTKKLKIPHMGWNKLTINQSDDIFKFNSNGDCMYFVHSFYAANCNDSVLASADYDIMIPAVVRSKNVYGMQFHPEKSGEKGLMLLKAFAKL